MGQRALIFILFFFCREALQEDADGSLRTAVDDIIHRAKRRKLLERPINIRLGMVDKTVCGINH